MTTLLRFSTLCALLILALAAFAAEAPGDFVLQDLLGRSWQNERVTFSLTEAQFRHAQAGHALLGGDDKPVPYQLIPNPTPQGARIAFLTDLAPFETRAFRFSDAPATGTGDLKIAEDTEAITLTNSKTGIRLPKTLKDGAGPIGGVRLLSGKWAGGSTLQSNQAVTAYSVEVLSRGPVSAEALCKATLADKSTWQLRVRLDANEPVVLLDELAEVDDPSAKLVVTLNRNFAPDSIFYRRGTQGSGTDATGSMETAKLADTDKKNVYTLEPWLRWQVMVRRGNWFALYGEQEADMLTVGALCPDLWVDLNRKGQAAPQLLLTQDGEDLQLTFPLKHGVRKWLIAVPEKVASLAILQEKDLLRAPLPQQSVIKHGNFPLDTVKDYTMQWKGDHDNYPRLYLTKADLVKYRARITDLTPFEKAVPHYLNSPMYTHLMDGFVQTYLLTQNKDLGKRVADFAVRWMQDAVDMYLKQNSLVTLGFAPHHQQAVITSLTMADLAMSGDVLTPEQRRRILAQAVFLGYTFNRKDNWDPARGFGGTPNMTTSLFGYKATVACFIPSHPLAKEWVKDAMVELNDQVNTWSDDNGGWLEAPHYAMVSYDQYLGSFLMARNAGFGDYLYSPKMKKVIEWFAKTSTPPDSRIGGFRHKPAIGNTYLQEPNGEFGIVAYLWRDKDPQFAAQMQWLFKQNNSYAQPGIGGAYPALTGYRRMLLDPTIPEKAPAYGSELFPKTGVILRSGFPTARETQLHMIQGSNHAHYDMDSGSITLYGKGRILAEDFGYTGYGAASDHSLVESPVANNWGILAVQDFQSKPTIDYVAGTCQLWTRQILFMKDADPLAPNYFAINDVLSVAAPATWRLWCTANKVAVGPQSALVEGKEDVDMDVLFLKPLPATLTTENRTRYSGSGLYPDWNWRGMESTQTGLIATIKRDTGFTTILYPRLKTEKPAAFTPLADGKGVKVVHAKGTDYIFMSATPFTYKEGDISFSGTVGAIQLRAKAKPVLFLGAGGTIAACGQKQTVNKSLPKAVTNLIANGDVESGVQDLFPPSADGRGGKLVATLFTGNPVAGDTTHKGTSCVAITLENGGGAFSLQRNIFIDPTKTYRVGLKIATTDEIGGTIGGYASSGAGNLPNLDGKGTWQYGLALKGPTDGWKTLETTIGPQGSNARVSWHPDTVSIGMTFWLYGKQATLYVDDIVVEEVK
ncbi:MAG: hypothetical protein ACYDBB_17920 [Armatimonadota bacterium]